MNVRGVLFAAPLFGLAVGAGCSSSSSGASGGADSGTGTDDGGGASSSSSSSSGGLPEASVMFTCKKAADCTTSGDVCCGTVSMGGSGPMGISLATACQAGTCSALPIVNIPLQPCATATECPSGDACGPVSSTPLGMYAGLLGIDTSTTVCQPSDGGTGTSSEAGSSGGGGSSSGGEGGASSSGGEAGASSSGGSEGGADAATDG